MSVTFSPPSIHRCGMEDLDFVDRVLNNPKNREFASDDRFRGPVDVGLLLSIPDVHVLRYGDWGLIIFTPFNAATYEYHMFLRSEVHGKFPYHYVWANDAIEWLFQNTECQKIIGMTIHNFEHADNIGFVREGKFSKSFLKDGKLLDLHLYGACKEGWKRPEGR